MSLRKAIEVVAKLAERGAVERYNLAALKGVLERHHLMNAWLKFCEKAEIENPLETI